MNMTDEYYSRLLAIARQNKGIRFIKNIKENQIEVELDNGYTEWKAFEDVINYKDKHERKIKRTSSKSR